MEAAGGEEVGAEGEEQGGREVGFPGEPQQHCDQGLVMLLIVDDR